MSNVTETKPIKCKHCGFEVLLVVRFDEDGLATQTGWNALKDHWYKSHPKEAALLDEYVYGSTQYAMPNENYSAVSINAELYDHQQVNAI